MDPTPRTPRVNEVSIRLSSAGLNNEKDRLYMYMYVCTWRFDILSHGLFIATQDATGTIWFINKITLWEMHEKVSFTVILFVYYIYLLIFFVWGGGRGAYMYLLSHMLFCCCWLNFTTESSLDKILPTTYSAIKRPNPSPMRVMDTPSGGLELYFTMFRQK